MKKSISFIIVISFILFTFLFCSCARSEYFVGRDTIECFGNGRYQMLEVSTYFDSKDCYILYDMKNDETLVEDVYGFQKIEDSVYLKGYNWDEVSYEKMYVILKEIDNRIVIKNENDLSKKEIMCFSSIDRYIYFCTDNHYAEKFVNVENDYPVGEFTADSFYEGKYQIVFFYGVRYPLKLFNMESNEILIDDLYGFCKSKSDYYFKGAEGSDKYIIINCDSGNYRIMKNENLSDDDKIVFKSINEYIY